MTLSLKDQFQIKTVPAFQAADGKRFHELTEAQSHTRDKMLESVINMACKDNPEYARLDKPLLKEFLLFTGEVVGKVMAEPLQPTVPTQASAPRTEPDNSIVERIRQAAGPNARPAETVMPRATNPDIFQNENKTIAAIRSISQEELDREVELGLRQAVL